MGKYPELEKVEQIQDKSQPVGEFLEWLTTERGIVLAQYHKHTEKCYGIDEFYKCGFNDDLLYPCRIGIEKLLAEFFHIDLDKVEMERRQLIKDNMELPKKKENP